MLHYLAVRCHNNSKHTIFLTEIEENAVWVAPPFEAECPVCKERQRFDGTHVKMIQVQQRIKNFQVHPAFK